MGSQVPGLNQADKTPYLDIPHGMRKIQALQIGIVNVLKAAPAISSNCAGSAVNLDQTRTLI